MTNLESVLKSRDITFPTKIPIVKAVVFLVVRYGCKSWAIKKAEYWRTDAFELWCWRRLWRVTWTARKITPVNSKGNQPWIFIERTDAKAEILWPPDAKRWFIRKHPNGKYWRQEEKGATEHEMVGWHHWLNVHEFEQPPGDCEGQGSLGCCSPWGRKESDTTEWMNSNKNLEGERESYFSSPRVVMEMMRDESGTRWVNRGKQGTNPIWLHRS